MIGSCELISKKLIRFMDFIFYFFFFQKHLFFLFEKFISKQI